MTSFEGDARAQRLIEPEPLKVTPHNPEKVAAGSTLTRSKATERLNLSGRLFRVVRGYH